MARYGIEGRQQLLPRLAERTAIARTVYPQVIVRAIQIELSDSPYASVLQAGTTTSLRSATMSSAAGRSISLLGNGSAAAVKAANAMASTRYGSDS